MITRSWLFRGKFVAQLQHAFDHDELEFHGRLHDLRHPKAWEGLLETLRNKKWVVYAKAPFRRSTPTAQVPRPLYPPGRHRQTAPSLDRRR